MTCLAPSAFAPSPGAVLSLLVLVAGSALAETDTTASGRHSAAARSGSRHSSRVEDQLRLTPVLLLPPDSTLVECETLPYAWRITPVNRDDLYQAVRALRLPVPLRAAIEAAVECAPGAECNHAVDPELLAQLPPKARAAIYPLLARHPANITYRTPFRFPGRNPEAVRARLPGIAAATFARLKRFLYPDGDTLLFANLPSVCATIAAAERPRLLRALNATQAVHVGLPITPRTDPAPIAEWFQRPGLIALVESMAASGGGTLDVADLLPRFAQERLDRFPMDPEPRLARNCFWTALNFGRETPDAALSDENAARAELASRYREVPPAEARYGDVFLFVRDNGAMVHAAVKIAGDVFFTRNGFTPQRPWALMRLEDIQLRYYGTRARAFRPLPR